jgi:hypothetical protein
MKKPQQQMIKYVHYFCCCQGQIEEIQTPLNNKQIKFYTLLEAWGVQNGKKETAGCPLVNSSHWKSPTRE